MYMDMYSTEVFSSLTEYQRALSTRVTNKVFAAANTHSHDTGAAAARFSGSESYEDADHLLLGGYTPAITRIAETMTANNTGNNTGEIQRRRRVYSQAGGRIVVSRYLNDSPTPFARRLQRHAPACVLNIYIDSAFGSGTAAKEIQNTEANILSVLSALENSGTRLNIYAGATSYATTNKKTFARQTLTAAVKIKDAGEALSVGAVAYPLAHPSFLRRHYFRWLETTTTPKLSKNFARNYGIVPNDTSTIKNALIGKIDSPVIIRASNYLNKSLPEITAAIKALINNR